MLNPLRVLTSGVELAGKEEPFFSNGKWRFAERMPWWDSYTGSIPVVIGHYWRRMRPGDRSAVDKGDPDLFENTHPLAWHGLHRNVFCVDYSVGGRWAERKAGTQQRSHFALAALRWPERELLLENGYTLRTTGFGDQD